MIPPTLNDDDIAKFLTSVASDLELATQVMCDSYGTLRPERIFKAQYLLGKISSELEIMADRLRLNHNALKSTREFKRILQREKEYQSDDEYFRRMGNTRAGLEPKPTPQETSNDD